MIDIINHLSESPQYPVIDIRHKLNSFNNDVIKEIERRLRLLNPILYNGSVTIYEDVNSIYKLTIESSEANTIERIKQLVQPYVDELNLL
jgi:hypothetical protein